MNVAANFGTTPTAGTPPIKLARSWAYEPMVVRVTDHVADDGSTGADSEGFALFCSARHGEPWKMVGHQGQHIIHPTPGAVAAPIAAGKDFSVIYVNYDYTTFT